MASRRLNREQKKAETRRALLAAARRVFARDGYHAASVEDVAEEAGYSHGAVYSNFAGKLDLFLATFEEYAASRASETLDAYQTGGPEFREKAKAAADSWMVRFDADQQSFLLHLELAARAARDRDGELQERFASRVRVVPDAMTYLIEEHVAERGLELPLPAEHVATLLHSLGIGLALTRLNDPDAVPPRLFGEFVEWLVRVVEEQTAQAERDRATRVA
jgi:AcrR family transcriptional regulator